MSRYTISYTKEDGTERKITRLAEDSVEAMRSFCDQYGYYFRTLELDSDRNFGEQSGVFNVYSKRIYNEWGTIQGYKFAYRAVVVREEA